MPKVTVNYKPEPGDPSPLPVVHNFGTASAALDFYRRQLKKPLVDSVKYEGK